MKVQIYAAFMLVVSLTFFLGSFIVSQGFPTGLAVNDGINLRIDDVQIHGNEALIAWKTKKESISTLTVNNKHVAFEAATEFEKRLTNLKAETNYDYAIKACSVGECEEIRSSFLTGGVTGTPITGAVVGVGSGLRKSVNYMLLLMVGMVILTVVSRIGYEQIKVRTSTSLPNLINKSNEYLKNDDLKGAYESYKEARAVYMQLEREAKIKHYDNLLNIYKSIRRQSDISMAQKLAEKYSDGSITHEELAKLNELLMG